MGHGSSPSGLAARRASSIRATRACENCRRAKGDHRRVLGLLVCPVLLSKRLEGNPTLLLASVVYQFTDKEAA